MTGDGLLAVVSPRRLFNFDDLSWVVSEPGAFLSRRPDDVCWRRSPFPNIDNSRQPLPTFSGKEVK